MTSASTGPVVSVVVLSYNHASYIAEAVESVLAQDLRESWEMVVADDASTDGTAAILAALAAGSGRVRRLPAESNLGMQHNLRRAIEATRGRYVAFLEGDDYWTDDTKLRRELEYLQAHPRIAAAGHLTEIVSFDGVSAGTDPERLFCRGLDGKSVVTLDDVMGEVFPHFSSLMYRRDLMPTTPTWFDEMQAADWPLCGLLAQQGDIAVLREVMSVYRKNAESSWAPRSHLERKLLVLDHMIVFRERACGSPSAYPAELAEAHLKVASVALSVGAYRVFVRHAWATLRLSPGATIRWGVTAARHRVGRLWAGMRRKVRSLRSTSP
jgi:glycosyltransferase involved in cell wall biosynthesis